MAVKIPDSGMEKLNQADARIKAAVLAYAALPNALPFTITCAPRGAAAQAAALKSGASKAQFGESPHNFVSPTGALAIDILPQGANLKYDASDWNLVDDFCAIARGIVAEAAKQGNKLRWGADWDMDGKTKAQGDKDEKFVDLPHVEIAGWKAEVAAKTAKLLKLA
jgi:peptidoglycan L-alanyl-D-glutamate endopeptidase CwlK